MTQQPAPTGTTTTALPPVVVDVTVRVPIESAFRAFTTDFDRWWPRSHHIGATEPEEVVMEPRAGGRWYERGADGVECDWGRVVSWAPPDHVRLAWNIDGSWTYRPGDENASRIDADFTSLEPSLTRVVVRHSGFESHGGTAAAVQQSVGSHGGWPSLMNLFTAFAERGRPA